MAAPWQLHAVVRRERKAAPAVAVPGHLGALAEW